MGRRWQIQEGASCKAFVVDQTSIYSHSVSYKNVEGDLYKAFNNENNNYATSSHFFP